MLFSLSAFLLSAGISLSQCPQGTAYATGTAPGPGSNVNITTCNFAGEYNTVNGVATGNSYTVTGTGGTGNYFTIYNSALSVVAFGPSPVSFTAASSGTFYTQVNTDAACGTDATCHTVNWSNTTPPPPCPGISSPFLEDFETFAATTANGTQNCWVTTSSTGFDWNVSAAGTPSSNTGAPAAFSGTKFFYTEASGAGIGAEAFLTSPDIDLSATTSPILRYKYHMFGAQTGSLNAEVSTDGGTTWTTIQTITGQQQATQASPWLESTASLNAYSGIIKLRFRAVSNGSFEGDISLDDVEIYQPTPVELELTSLDNVPATGCGLGLESVGITITEFGSTGLVAGDTIFATYDDGTTLIEDTIILASPLTPGNTYVHTFSQLVDYSAFGTYNVTVTSFATADGSVGNDQITTTITNVPVVNTFPYFEDFESGQNGWVVDNTTNGATAGTWGFGTPAHPIMNSAASGDSAFSTGFLTGTYSANTNAWVTSPCFDMTSAVGDEQLALSVWWQSEFSWDGANITYSTDGGTTWNLLGAFGDPNNWYTDNTINGNPGGSQQGWTGREVSSNGSGGWVTAKQDIPTALFAESAVRFRVNFGSDGSVQDEGFSFDNFAIASPPVFDAFPDTISICDTILGTTTDPGLWNGYLWDSGETTRYSEINTTGIHWVEVTGPYGTCARDSFFVDTFYNAIPPGLEDLRLICYPDTTILDAGTDTINTYNYTWSTGATTSSIPVNTAGIYTITKTDITGTCSFDDTIEIVVAQVDLGPSTVGYCSGAIPTLDAGPGGVTYLWNSGQSTQTITPTMEGAYSVTVIDTNGCLLIDAINIVESTPVVDLGPNQTICVNQSTTLDAENPGASYLWSNATTGQTITVDGATAGVGTYNYSVTVTDSVGCTATDAITVTVDACAGLDELAGVEMNIYPNPSNGIFNYTMSNVSETVIMTISDLSGRVVANDMIATEKGTIDLTTYETGVYILNIQIGDASSSVRLLKQ